MPDPFEDALATAWKRHTKDSLGVREALQTMPSPADDQQLLALAQLACHVFGEHLGDWQGGLTYLAHLERQNPPIGAGTLSRLRRQSNILEQARDPALRLDQLSDEDRYYVEVLAVPAAALQLGAPGAGRILQAARDTGLRLGDSPAQRRLLAIVLSNLTCDLLERADSNAADLSFLIEIAEAASTFWNAHGDESDRARANYRLCQAYHLSRRPRDYGSGRYARALFVTA